VGRADQIVLRKLMAGVEEEVLLEPGLEEKDVPLEPGLEAAAAVGSNRPQRWKASATRFLSSAFLTASAIGIYQTLQWKLHGAGLVHSNSGTLPIISEAETPLLWEYGKLNGYGCAEHLSDKECKQAATNAKIKWNRVAGWHNKPHGCYYDNNQFYFNTAPGRQHDKATPVCKRNPVKIWEFGELNTNGCNEYLSEKECELGAKQEGIKWNRVAGWHNKPHGCYYDNDQFYFNKSPGKKDPKAQPVCKLPSEQHQPDGKGEQPDQEKEWKPVLFSDMKAGENYVWDKQPNKVLHGYAKFPGSTKYNTGKYTLQGAKDMCIKIASQCFGVTCTKSNECTTRGGSDLKDSPSGETTYVLRHVAGDWGWQKHPKKRMVAFAGGDHQLRALPAAKYRCVELKDCTGITCREYQSECTVHSGTTLEDSQSMATWVRGDPNNLPPSLKVKFEKTEGKSKIWPKKRDCKPDWELRCKLDGHGDESYCCQENSVCRQSGHLMVCQNTPTHLWEGNRCDHRGQNQAQRDDVCSQGLLCSMLGKEGRDFGCKEYYCCARPSEKWLNANKKEEKCIETVGWKDSDGDGCDWYEGAPARCEVYKDSGANTHCCYCQPGKGGGEAANTFCEWTTERDIMKAKGHQHKDWTVVLTGNGKPLEDGAVLEKGRTFKKDCEWFEGASDSKDFENTYDRCATYGDEVGEEKLKANDVCCYCRYGKKVHAMTGDDDYYFG